MATPSPPKSKLDGIPELPGEIERREYLAGMPNAHDTLSKLGEGRQAEIFAWTEGAVLKLFRDPAARGAAEWEAIATGAASACARAPAVHGVITVQDRPGLIIDRADGRDLLTLLGGQPWKLFHAARLLGQLHAEIHGVSAPPELPALRVAVRQRIEASDSVPPNFAQLALGVLETLPDGDPCVTAICTRATS